MMVPSLAWLALMKTWLKQNRSVLLFFALFGVFRLAVADWNVVPSGSMRPTLVECDVVFYNRLAYDVKVPLTDKVVMPIGGPQRGDVVIFSSPRDGTRLIKRLVALPDDVVSMVDGELRINGVAASYRNDHVVRDEPLGDHAVTQALRLTEVSSGHERVVQYLPQVAAVRDVAPVRVPEGHYWMMGDSRDNSVDSRSYGPVPRHLLIGKASRVLVSGSYWPPRVRLERVGLGL
jgi:signal peptidase I